VVTVLLIIGITLVIFLATRIRRSIRNRQERRRRRHEGLPPPDPP
jgi:predicted RND superfamily exporter protein